MPTWTVVQGSGPSYGPFHHKDEAMKFCRDRALVYPRIEEQVSPGDAPKQDRLAEDYGPPVTFVVVPKSQPTYATDYAIGPFDAYDVADKHRQRYRFQEHRVIEMRAPGWEEDFVSEEGMK